MSKSYSIFTGVPSHGSINGENKHYGTPTNPYAPDRVPGGSSSGSAVAVAAKLVDFSLGPYISYKLLLYSYTLRIGPIFDY